MATDKSINIRQVQATEELAAALAQLNQKTDEIKQALAEIRAIVVTLIQDKPESKLQAVSRSVARK